MYVNINLIFVPNVRLSIPLCKLYNISLRHACTLYMYIVIFMQVWSSSKILVYEF